MRVFGLSLLVVLIVPAIAMTDEISVPETGAEEESGASALNAGEGNPEEAPLEESAVASPEGTPEEGPVEEKQPAEDAASEEIEAPREPPKDDDAVAPAKPDGSDKDKKNSKKKKDKEEESEASIQEKREAFRKARILAIAGVASWGTGVGIVFSGVFTGFISDPMDDVGDGMTYSEAQKKADRLQRVGISLIAVGATLDVFGTIPCIVGERMAKNRIGQDDFQKLGSKKGMSSGAIWGVSVGLTIFGASLTALPYKPAWIAGLAIAGAGEVLRGFATIAPLVRIPRYAQKHKLAWSAAPVWQPGPVGMKGLAVGALF